MASPGVPGGTPAVHPRQPSQQPEHERPHPCLRLSPPEPARDEPRAPQEAAGEQEPGTGQGDVTAAAGRPPQTASGESQDEPLVSGDDNEDLPAARVTAAGATADPVKDYLKQIGRVPLLNARQEVELAKRFGLTEGQPKTLDEIGKVYGVTRERIRQIESKTERIRQIESKTMSKLRHPSRSEVLRDYLA